MHFLFFPFLLMKIVKDKEIGRAMTMMNAAPMHAHERENLEPPTSVPKPKKSLSQQKRENNLNLLIRS